MYADYLANSPYTRALVDTFGMLVRLDVAERVAVEHGTTVAELVTGGLAISRSRVHAIELTMALGY